MGWITILLGYLIGCFPTAYIFGKKFLGKDIRHLGDGNIGARNAYHELGHKAGLIIFFIDLSKGLAIILLSKLLDISQNFTMASGIATVAGHNFPIFLKFRGGRGEATTMGILIGLLPLASLIVAMPTIISLLVWKNVIKTSIVCFVTMPVVCWILKEPALLVAYVLVLPIMVAITHFFRARSLKKAMMRLGTTRFSGQ